MISKRPHPRLALAGAAVLAALLLGGLYRVGRDSWARSHLGAAQEAVTRYDWGEAREHLKTYLRGRPDDPGARLLAARSARHLDLLDEAGEHLEEAALRVGETPAVLVERALLRVYRGDLAGQEPFLRARLAGDDPDAVEILDILSAAMILNYRVIDAQHCLDDWLRRQPDHFHALTRRGWVARSLTRYAEAVEYYEKALALRPEVDTVRLALGEIQVALGRVGDAQGHFEELYARQPNNTSVLFGLARCRAGTGRPDEARRLLDRVFVADPNDWKALGERGRLELQADRPADAEKYFRRAVFLAPPDAPLLSRFADCLNLLGKKDEAREVRARADALVAEFARAEQLGKVIRESKPDDPEPRHELAGLLLRLGKTEDALHWFRTALEKDPRHRPTHQALAEFHAKAGNSEQAARHRQFLE